MEKLSPIARFNNHGKDCQNHQNWMLDCEYTTREERDLLIKCIDNVLGKDEIGKDEKN